MTHNTVLLHSRYNLLQGCSVAIFFARQQLLKPTVSNFSTLAPLDKLKHLLEELDKQYPQFWQLDHPDDKLNGKTKELLNEQGLSLFRQLKADLDNQSSDELLRFLEFEFKKAF